VVSANGFAIAKIKRNDKGVTLTVPDNDAPGFARWFDGEADTLMQELYARWLNTRAKD
jgi:hypothetical protein